MQLEEFLAQRKTDIVNLWFESVLNTYAPDTAAFYKGQKNAFANPVGSTMRRALGELFDHLLEGQNSPDTQLLLDSLIRIRAVQDFSASQATCFVLDLKKIIGERYRRELDDAQCLRQWVRFQSRIDDMSLTAFDVYMACREKIYDMKANVEKNKIYKAFSRAGLVKDIPDDKPDLITS